MIWKSEVPTLLVLMVMLKPSPTSPSTCHLPPTLANHCTCPSTTSLFCGNLLSASSLSTSTTHLLKSLTHLSLQSSSLPCLPQTLLASMPHLTHLKISNSSLESLICQKSRHRKAVHRHLRHLQSLDLSNNLLQSLNLHTHHELPRLSHLNLSHNLLSGPPMPLSSLPNLASIDLSHNRLGAATQVESFESPPISLQALNLSHNPWPCVPHLAWLHSWAARLSPPIRSQLAELECQVENSNQRSPLLQVMEYYSKSVAPWCPSSCSCTFYHFARVQGPSPPSYTVLVNCSGQGLTTFPRVPPQTTVLDLSRNSLGEDAWDSLHLDKMNYLDISGLSLAHNKFTSIDEKLLSLQLHRAFRAEDNLLTEVPYDFSLLLQKYDKNVITLGHNPWTCLCNSEITNMNLRLKLSDLEDVVCASASRPQELAGQQVASLDPEQLCPVSSEGQQKEFLMQLLCVVLAMVNIMVVSKLLYDYYQYKHKGKLPRIVHWLPYI